jgi:hypothetical protein
VPVCGRRTSSRTRTDERVGRWVLQPCWIPVDAG